MKLPTVRALLTVLAFNLSVAILVSVSVTSRSSVGSEELQFLVADVGSTSSTATSAVDRRLINATGADSPREDGDGRVEKRGPSASSSPPLLCLFTTFKPSKKKYQVYTNTLRNWVSVDNGSGQIVPLLYYTTDPANTTNQMKTRDLDEPLLTMARRLGWQVVAAPRVTESGVPYLKDMFRDAMERLKDCTFYGYSNGDILYTGGLMSTLRAVEKALDRLGTTMIIGRRTNVNVTSTTSTLYLPDDVERTALRVGQLFVQSAEDYFITSSAVADVDRPGFPWHRIADVVIGRPAYDNYLVMAAMKNNVSVVDATISLTAVHLSDAEGTWAGHRTKDRRVNVQRIGVFNFRLGFTQSCQYFTNDTSAGGDGASGEITIHWRKLSSRYPFSLYPALPATLKPPDRKPAPARSGSLPSSRGRNGTIVVADWKRFKYIRRRRL